jgi:hypothetical protein
MNLVEGEIIRIAVAWSVAGGAQNDSLIVFRRNDNRKRINICGRRYKFDEQTNMQLLLIPGPGVGVGNPKAFILLDDNGDVTRLEVAGHSFNFGAPDFPEYDADLFAVRECLQEIVSRQEFIRIAMTLFTDEEAA